MNGDNEFEHPQPISSAQVWLWFGILIFPIIFAWFTLRPGYSRLARAVALTWTALFILSLVEQYMEPQAPRRHSVAAMASSTAKITPASATPAVASIQAASLPTKSEAPVTDHATDVSEARAFWKSLIAQTAPCDAWSSRLGRTRNVYALYAGARLAQDSCRGVPSHTYLPEHASSEVSAALTSALGTVSEAYEMEAQAYGQIASMANVGVSPQQVYDARQTNMMAKLAFVSASSQIVNAFRKEKVEPSEYMAGKTSIRNHRHSAAPSAADGLN